MSALLQTAYDVGGVMLPRPFKIRRLSHSGLNVEDVQACLPFYRDLLGFRVADELELAGRFKSPSEAKRFPFTRGLFMRHGTDHHSLVIFPKRVLNALAGYPPLTTSSTLNQIAWQVGSLREVSDAIGWLQRRDIDLLRIGRDQPGGNWHVYSFDPDRYVNEMFYGLEQIGWSGRSKPLSAYGRSLDAPSLPVDSEQRELQIAEERGVDMTSGYQPQPDIAGEYDVDGVVLSRPFKIVGVGPVRLFCSDLDASLAYYRDLLGLAVTQEIRYHGHRCVFLRAGTEHHALALYPEALRADIPFAGSSPVLSNGVQVANYNQLRAAIQHLMSHGVKCHTLAPEISSGIDYSVFAQDPEGNTIQLYYQMDQIGWDGCTREAVARPQHPDDWPASVVGRPDSYAGATFMGPWG